MRILYFSRSYTSHDVRFLSALAESDHEVYFLRLQPNNLNIDHRPLSAGVKSVRWSKVLSPLSIKNILQYRAELKRIVAEIKPDLIHAGPIQSCAFLSAISGFKPLISMSWGSDLMVESSRNLLNKIVTKYTLSRSTLLLVDNQAVEQKAIALGMLRRRIVKFPWGVDLQQFAPSNSDELRQSLGWQNNFVLLSLRALEPIYGVDVLAHAFSLAQKESPGLRLLLLGVGSQAEKIRQILDEAGVTQFVFFGGQISQTDLPTIYDNTDLYISTSHSDGSSVSLMEALASGKPVLVSDIPGNREWVQPGMNGWFFEDGNVNDLKKKILSIYADRGSLAEMSQRSRKIAEDKADWRVHRNALLQSYPYAKRLTKG